MLIHIVGQPASGKTFLAQRLASDLGIPAFAIDDERRRLLRPGDWWPREDHEAWLALGAKVEDAGACIVETSGGAVNEALALGNEPAFTILCRADATVRRERLRERMKRPFQLLGRPSPSYVDRLLNAFETRRTPDAVWTGEGADYPDLLTRCREALNG